MKKLNKKGFTIVELVIVIAVIAILAGVLIPTFASIVKKANQSADIQAVRQMNTVLTGETLADIDALIDHLDENGYNSKKSLTPITKGYSFVWSETNNVIILLNENNEVVFPEGAELGEKSHNLEASSIYINTVATDAASFAEAVTNGQKDIKLEADVEVSAPLTVLAGSEVTIDLNGKKLTAGWADENNGKHMYGIDVYGTLVLENGTVSARGVQTYSGANLTIKDGVTIESIDDNGGAAVYNRAGATLTIEGGTFTAKKATGALTGASALINDGGTVIITGGTFNGAPGASPYAVSNWGGTMTIDGATINANRGGLAASGGTVTVENVTITLASGAEAYCVYAGAGEVTVKAGTLTGGASTYCTEGTGVINTIDGNKLSGNDKQ